MTCPACHSPATAPACTTCGLLLYLCRHAVNRGQRECARCIADEAAWFDGIGPHGGHNAFVRAATPRALWKGVVFE